ncbi:hypothetical protein [Mesorhizobium sp.]|uniref:hypothetical protein n=1 Tax=Mesorhizobium sp. TaxID=1871066 RepID=UPI00257FE814|nr:hypothetical protein [Mesorhizobium sp.]
MTRLASLAAGALLAVSAAPANGGPPEDRNIQLIKDYYAAYATGTRRRFGPSWRPTSCGAFPATIR